MSVNDGLLWVDEESAVSIEPLLDTPDPERERDAVTQLRQLNLNLLPMLQRLLRTRSVSQTAAALELTPPAVSQALRQLRTLLNDELLVRVGREVHLTERAEALAGPLSRLVVELGSLLKTPTPFDPATEQVQFRIASVDYVGHLLAPGLVAHCRRHAPGVSVQFEHVEIRGAEDLMQLDFVIAPRDVWMTIGKRAMSLELWRDEVVCIAGRANALAVEHMTPEEFSRHPHVGFELPWASPQERSRLQSTYALETGRVCTSNTYLALGPIVAQSDCLALVPRRAVQMMARQENLRILPFAHAQNPLIVDAYWGRGADEKRGHRWFRELMRSVAAEFPPL